MLKMLASVRGRLESEDGTMKQLQGYLFLLRIYLPLKRQFERKFQFKEQSSSQSSTSSWNFPPFPTTLRVYNVISNVLLSWIFFKVLFPVPFVLFGRLFGQLIGLDNHSSNEQQYPSSCHVFGRVVIHYDISTESIACLVASFHLIWRLAQQTLDRPFLLEVVLFLMQPKENIERFIKKLNSTDWLSTPNKVHLTDYEQFLCEITCFKVHFSQPDPRVLYKLRPNRTLDARRQLIKSLSTMTIRVVAIFGFLLVLFIVYIVSVLFFNQHRYVNAYGGCDLEFDTLFSEGKLAHWALPRPRRHYLATILFDTLENVTLWLESGLVLLFGLLFSMYLNGDLQIYWANVNKELRHKLIKSKQSFKHQLNDVNSTGNMWQQLTSVDLELQIKEEIYSLQAELRDFFTQIKQVDMLISDIYTHALFIWFTGFGVVSFESVQVYSNQHSTNFAIVCIGFCLLVFAGFVVSGVRLLSLQRSCKLSYSSICSLMAHDQTRHKRHFMRLVDFYTRGNRTCYTLFHEFPFSSTNFVSIIGWTLSCFLLSDNVFRGR